MDNKKDVREQFSDILFLKILIFLFANILRYLKVYGMKFENLRGLNLPMRK